MAAQVHFVHAVNRYFCVELLAEGEPRFVIGYTATGTELLWGPGEKMTFEARAAIDAARTKAVKAKLGV